jgi:hypothetical protein
VLRMICVVPLRLPLLRISADQSNMIIHGELNKFAVNVAMGCNNLGGVYRRSDNTRSLCLLRTKVRCRCRSEDAVRQHIKLNGVGNSR